MSKRVFYGLAGVVSIGAVLTIPYLLGATFGQRCAAYYQPRSLEFELCIEGLAEGKKMSAILQMHTKNATHDRH